MTANNRRKPRPALNAGSLDELALRYVGRFATTRFANGWGYVTYTATTVQITVVPCALEYLFDAASGTTVPSQIFASAGSRRGVLVACEPVAAVMVTLG